MSWRVKRSIEIFGLLQSRSSRRGFSGTSLKFLARTVFHSPVGAAVTTLDNGVDGPYYGGPTDAKEGVPPYLTRDLGPGDFDVPCKAQPSKSNVTVNT